MTKEEGGAKWSKLMTKLKPENEDHDDVDDVDQSVHGEGGNDDAKTEAGATSGHFQSSDGMSATLDRVSGSFLVSLQWLDQICGITPTSKRGQIVYMFIMLLIPLIPIMALITQNIIMLNNIIIRKSDLLNADLNVLKSDETADLVGALQQERSASLMYIYVPQAVENSVLDIDVQRLLTDTALEAISEWRAPAGEDMFRSKLRLQIRIDDFRQLQDARNNTEKLAFEVLEFYTYTTRTLLKDLTGIIKTSNGSRSWRYLVTYKNMMRAIESLGVEISFGIVFIGSGVINIEDFARFVENHHICEEYLKQSEALLSDIRGTIRTIRKSPEFMQYSARYQRLVKKEVVKEKLVEDMTVYFKNSFEVLKKLRMVLVEIRTKMKLLIAEEIAVVDREYVVGICILVIILIISPVMVVLVRNAVNALQIFSRLNYFVLREFRPLLNVNFYFLIMSLSISLIF